MAPEDHNGQLGAAAETLAGKGFRVFPLRPGDKRPQLKGWQHRATARLLQVRVWWRQWPAANIGIATGGDEGLVVIDVDPRHGGAIDPAWPETAQVATPSGGAHLYYRCDAVIRNSAGALADGVDVRGDGGYVVAPPSRTEAGAYAWSHLPAREIASAPPQMFSTPHRSRRGSTGGTTGRRFALRDRAGEGERNSYLASYAGWLYANGYEHGEAEEILLEENAASCVPPLDSEEVERIAASIAQTHHARKGR